MSQPPYPPYGQPGYGQPGYPTYGQPAQATQATQPAYFRGVENATPSLGGVYVLPGIHVFAVSKVSIVSSQQKAGITYFVAELITLITDNPDMREGESRSWLVDFSKPSALGNIRGFLAAVLNVPFERIGENQCQWAISQENPLLGKQVACQAFMVKTRAGNDFTKHVWSPWSNE